MKPFIRYETTGSIATITLDDPDARNALSTFDQWRELVQAIDRVQADMSVKCLILTGAGSAFCAGGNVKDMQAKVGIASGDGYRIREGYRTGIQQIPLAMARLEVPAIAAVNGPAIGAGCDLACMCDIRIASERARFAESFVKVGIVPGDGGAWLLQRIVGYAKAAELTFTGDTINAEEALQCGLVSKIVPGAELLPEAMKLAERIAANAGPAVRMAKRLLREAQHQRIESLLEMSAAYQALAHHTPEHDQAVAAVVASLAKK